MTPMIANQVETVYHYVAV